MENQEQKQTIEIPKKSEKRKGGPYKKAIYDTYILWLTMPAVLRHRDMDSNKLLGFGFDIEDEIFKKLITIGTRTQFSNEFHVNKDTLTAWEQSEECKNLLEKTRQEMVLKYEKDVDFHFTQQTIKEADAARVKLWKQLYRGWREKQDYNIQSDDIKLLTKEISKITNSWKKDDYTGHNEGDGCGPTPDEGSQGISS